MKQIALTDVIVVDRHRSDLGDLTQLAESIRENGLLHPIVVTPSNRLVAGQRRLEACRLLGFEEIPVTVATNLTSAASLLRAERDENTCRKEMTPLERKSLTDALLELERPAAEERMKAGRPSGPGNTGSAADIAAEAAGWSRASYDRATRVIEAATDPATPEPVREVALQAAADMEAGRIAVKPAAEKVAKAQIVHAKDKTEQPVRRSQDERSKQIAGLSARGYAPRQIATELGISEQRVRDVAKANGVALITALDRTRRIDSNRVVNEAVNTLEAIAMSVGLVEVDQLDRTQVEHWATSLSNSLSPLKRLEKQLKEMAR